MGVMKIKEIKICKEFIKAHLFLKPGQIMIRSESPNGLILNIERIG